MHKIIGPEVLPLSGKQAKQLVVMLHGVGADGENLIDLANNFQDMLPDAHFIAPNAPFPYENAPIGYQWFSLNDRSEKALLGGMEIAMPILNAFIDQQLERFNLSEDKLILIGFSQGTMMSLHLSFRRKNPLAAVIGFSGALIGEQALERELNSRPPVLLVHGEEDSVVPFPLMLYASRVLHKMSIPITTYKCEGLGHMINLEGINKARDFLKQLI
ncbi:Carboxylesterase 2 [Rickettsiales bacterium Ac37b]|nr:Carboxylesterase 2 [Rickettsiales bacterium Ac37b]